MKIGDLVKIRDKAKNTSLVTCEGDIGIILSEGNVFNDGWVVFFGDVARGYEMEEVELELINENR